MKRFLLAVLTITISVSLAAQAPTALWGKSVQTLKQTMGYALQVDKDGYIYTTGTGKTRTENDYITLGGVNIAPGTVYRGSNENSSCSMMYVSKLTSNGAPVWTVYSQDADVSTGGILLKPVTDGAVIATTLRHTEKGGAYSPYFVDAAGNTVKLDWNITENASRYYIGCVANVNSNGVIQWVRKILPDDVTKSESLSIDDIKTDADGNIWLCGQLYGTITLQKADGTPVSISSQLQDSNCDLLLIKLDAEGYYLNHLQTTGSANSLAIYNLAFSDSQMYVLGMLTGKEESTGEVSIGGKTLSWDGKFGRIFTASLNADMSIKWIQDYPSKITTSVNNLGMTIISNNIWITGMMALSVTAKSGKTITTGDLNRDAVVLKVDASNGNLTDGYARGKQQQGYYGFFQDTDGYAYLVGSQGVWAKTEPKMLTGGAMFIDKFNAGDLSAPISTVDEIIQNAPSCTAILATADSRLYTMTRSQQTSNYLYGGVLTTGQTTAEYSVNLCAFQLPVTPVTAIRTIRTETTPTADYYTLSGQRVTMPSRGLYIQGGRKVIVK